MADDQRRARVFGVLFIITFLTSIPAALLYQPALDDPAGYLAGEGQDNLIRLGAFLEFLLIIANVGTTVVLYPIARRQNEILAIGYVAARIIESVFIAAGILFVLGLVSLRQDSPGAADLAVSLAALAYAAPSTRRRRADHTPASRAKWCHRGHDASRTSWPRRRPRRSSVRP
jgi:Domain of unknown function (DUF4386)